MTSATMIVPDTAGSARDVEQLAAPAPGARRGLGHRMRAL